MGLVCCVVRRMRALVTRDRERLWVGRHEVPESDNSWVFQPGTHTDVSAVSVQQALTRLADYDGPEERYGVDPRTGRRTTISAGPRTYDLFVSQIEFDDPDELFLPEPVSFRFSDGELRLLVEVPDHDPDEDRVGTALQLIQPLCDRVGCRSAIAEDRFYTEFAVIELRTSLFRRSLGALFDMGRQVRALLEAMVDGALSPATARDMVLSGNADLLVGLAESQWLDAKRKITGPREFAKDVAAFANTGGTELLVYGLGTKSQRDGDQISGVVPMAKGDFNVKQLYDVLSGRLRPRPLGVKIDTVEVPGGLLATVLIPAQTDSRLPVLIVGATVEGAVRENYVGIPVRLGEHTFWEDASTVQAYIAAGRAVLTVTDRPRP